MSAISVTAPNAENRILWIYAWPYVHLKVNCPIAPYRALFLLMYDCVWV